MVEPGPRIIAIATRLYAPIDVKVTEASTLAEDLQMDYRDIVEFIMEIEDTFEISIPDAKIGTFETIGDIVKFVKDTKWWT